MVEIKHIKHGIACRIGNNIYMNENLKKYPKLYDKIIEHEKAHSEGFETKDILIDLNNKHLSEVKREYYKFIITHPSSWTEYLPFGFYDNHFVLNPILSVFWIISLIGGYFLWKLIGLI